MNIESEYEKALAERESIEAELNKLTEKELQQSHYIRSLQNRYKEEKRRSRTHRLIERGAILESLIPAAEKYSNEQIQHILRIAFANLPEGIRGIHFPASAIEESEKAVL